MTASTKGCGWWVIKGKHPPRRCGAPTTGTRRGVTSCAHHMRVNLAVVAVVADTIRRILDESESLSLDSADDRAELLKRLVEGLETPL